MTQLTSELLFKLPMPLKLGEGPIYRFEDHTLHYIDFKAQEVHILPLDGESCMPDKSRKHTVLKVSEPVTCLYFQKNKPEYICLYFGGLGEVSEETGKFTNLVTLCDVKTTRMNDGVVDPKGRLWAGEMDIDTAHGPLGYTNRPVGRLLQYTSDGQVKTIIPDGLAISNGIGFSPDFTKFYLNDSKGQRTYVFDFDLEAGTLSNQRILHDFRGSLDEPDGMVVDVEGNLWSALYNGYAVAQIDGKTGEILQRVHIPAQAVTCPTWGGENNDTLLITTGGASGTDHDGHLYKIKTNTKGMPNFKFGN